MIRNKRILGLINLMEDDSKLSPITVNRPTAAIPFGGRYRVIDFVLSNISAAGIDTVGIFLKDKERALMDHIKSGKAWDLDRMQGGIFYFTPSSTKDMITEIRGDISTFYNNIDILSKSNCEYVLLSGSNMVLNIDFNKVLDEHIKSEADVSVIYKNVDKDNNSFNNTNTLMVEDNKVTSFGRRIRSKVNNTTSINESEKVSLDIFILKTSLLIRLIEDAISTGKYVYINEVLKENTKNYNYVGYEFKEYVGYISNIENYFKISQDLLQEEVIKEIFYGPSKIYTKVRNEAPAYYSKDAISTNSLVANGCEIYGEIENCVLFRRVIVEKGVKLKNCIIMQNTIIKENSQLENIITDKNVTIESNVSLKGTTENPLVIEKEKVISK